MTPMLHDLYEMLLGFCVLAGLTCVIMWMWYKLRYDAVTDKDYYLFQIFKKNLQDQRMREEEERMAIIKKEQAEAKVAWEKMIDDKSLEMWEKYEKSTHK
jgi:hypothetical protein